MKKYLFLLFLGVFLISNASAVISRNLSVGVSGSDVAELQSKLGVQSTGYYGNLTKQAVKAWQMKNNLPNSGYFGILSKKIWNSSVDEDIYPVRLPPIPVGSSVDPVRLPPISEDFCTYVKGTVIRVLSPNGGEVYQAGQQITVKWKTCNVPTDANIKLGLGYNGAGGGSAGDMWLSNLFGSQDFVNDGSETITIPNNFSWPSSLISSGKYYSLSAEYSNSANLIRDVSDDTFTINSQATTVCDSTVTPSIKVLSPNGGEVYQAGQQVEIKWKNCNTPAGSLTRILMARNMPNNHQDGYVILETTNNHSLDRGSFVWTIPNNQPTATNYFISVVCGNPDGSNCSTGSGNIVYAITDDTDGNFTINGPTTVVVDTTPRIAMWYGKVNQHTNSNGEWITDPDGVSGAGNYSQWGSEGYGDRKLEYCKKFYPNTTSVSDYKNESINSWREKYNVGGPYTASFMTTKCIQGSEELNQYIKLLSPKVSDTFTAGQNVNISWSTNASQNTYVYLSIFDSNMNFVREIRTPNDYQETIKIPLATPAGKYRIYYQVVAGPNDSGYNMSDFISVNVVSPNITTNDTTPRIAYWWGKVNQHFEQIDVRGEWMTDGDGVSGANLDKLTYCKKFYPNTISIADYKNETITGWRNAGNTGGPYTLEVMTTKCVFR
ncbi:MAG: hypothetical protein RI945_120 [Candidatus Parcubacteria bacterium]|jgi:hypothetical protein